MLLSERIMIKTGFIPWSCVYLNTFIYIKKSGRHTQKCFEKFIQFLGYLGSTTMDKIGWILVAMEFIFYWGKTENKQNSKFTKERHSMPYSDKYNGSECPSGGRWGCSLYKVVLEGLTDKVTFEQWSEGPWECDGWDIKFSIWKNLSGCHI